MNARTLTEDELQTAALILCCPERLRVHKYNQDQFDFFCETVSDLRIAAREADHDWLAQALEEALFIAEARFLEREGV